MAAAINLGELIASIGADIAPLQQKLKEAEKLIQDSSKEMSKGMDKFQDSLKKTGEQLKSVGKSMSLYLTAPILAAAGASFKLASDMDEAINKVNVAFGNSAGDVIAWSDTTLEAFGIAKGSALDMAALFGDMSTSMGLTQPEAAKMSKSLVGLAGDLASFKNIGIEQAQTALAGIFTGETESLKRIGIVMNQVNLQEYALSKGIRKRVDEMTQAEKVQLRYAYVMDSTKNVQGDYIRTSEGAANQMRKFRESLKEVGETFGRVLLPIITPVIKKLNEMMKWLSSLTEVQKKWAVGIALVVAAIGPLLLVLGYLMTNVIPGLITAWGAVKVAMTAVGGAFGRLTAIMMANPLGALLTVLGLIAGALLLFKNRTREAEEAQWKLGDAVGEVNKQLGEQIYFSLVGGYKVLANGALVAIGGIDKLSTSIGKLTREELMSLKMYLEDEIPKAMREADNAMGSLTGTIIEQDLKKYQTALAAVNQELNKFRTTKERVNPVMREFTENMEDNYEVLNKWSALSTKIDGVDDSLVAYMGTSKDFFEQMADWDRETDNLISGWEQVKLQVIDVTNEVNNLIMGMVSAFLEGIAHMITGAGDIGDLFGSVLSVFGDFLIQMGEALITAGLMMQAAEFLATNPAGAIVIGGLAIVAGYVLKDMAAEGFATGGIVPPGYPGDSYPALLTSGEAVVPAKQLPDLGGSNVNVSVQVTGISRGEDMKYVLQRVDNRLNRIG
jgi:prefoldin subunit 5